MTKLEANLKPVKNLRAFISEYLKSDNGKRVLARSPYRNKDGKQVWNTVTVANAFAKAVA